VFVCKKLFHVRNRRRYAIGRQAGEEGLAVSLPGDAGVEEDQDATSLKRF
jgi:hypothetical protein